MSRNGFLQRRRGPVEAERNEVLANLDRIDAVYSGYLTSTRPAVDPGPDGEVSDVELEAPVEEPAVP